MSTAQQHMLHLQRPCSKLGHNHKSWVDISFGGHDSIHHKRSHGIHWANKQAGTSRLTLCDQHMVLAYGSLMLNYLSLTWCLFQPKQSFFILYCVVWSLGQENHLEKGMATHSSILAWRIPWTEEPGGLYSMGSQRVRHD